MEARSWAQRLVMNIGWSIAGRLWLGWALLGYGRSGVLRVVAVVSKLRFSGRRVETNPNRDVKYKFVGELC